MVVARSLRLLGGQEFALEGVTDEGWDALHAPSLKGAGPSELCRPWLVMAPSRTCRDSRRGVEFVVCAGGGEELVDGCEGNERSGGRAGWYVAGQFPATRTTREHATYCTKYA